MRKALSVIGDILIALVVIFSVLMTTMVIISTRDEDGVPSLFGYAIMNVETDSMVGENGFDPGTLIVVRKLSEEEIEHDLHPGDVITFRRYANNEPYLETHRIVEITEEMVKNNPACSIIMKEVVDGAWKHGQWTYYVTRGDNTPGEDVNASGNYDFASVFNIVGIWTGQKVPKLGAVMMFLRSPNGFMICIVIPVLAFFIYQLYIFIMTLTRKQKEKTLAEVADKEEELKAKAVAEFLAQQAAANGGAQQAKPADPPPAETKADKPADKPAEKPEEKSAEKPAEKAEEKSAENAEEKSAQAASPADISDEEKQRIIQEYLAKQQQQDNA